MLLLSEIVQVQVTHTFTVPRGFPLPTYPAAHHILFFHRISMTALVYLILMTLDNSHSTVQDVPPPSPSNPPMESAASLLTSATLQDLCAPPALYSAPIFSWAH